MSDQLILSPGWSHYVISAPLSPKALTAVTRQLKTFVGRDHTLRPFRQSALTLAILDLGVLPESIEPRLITLLKRALVPFASQQLHARAWELEPLSIETSGSASSSAALWLTWEDRLGEFQALSRSIRDHLRGGLNGISEVTEVTPQASELSSRARQRKSWGTLCGSISHYKAEGYRPQVKCSSWINHVDLKKRPQRFDPANGYQDVWRHTLPLETPTLIEQEIPSHSPSNSQRTYAQQESSRDQALRDQSLRDQASHDRSTLSARSLELLDRLEEKLKALDAHPPHPNAPSRPHQGSRQGHKHQPQRQSQSSTPGSTQDRPERSAKRRRRRKR